MSDLKVISRSFTILEAINVVDVVLSKPQSELLIKGVYATNDPKDIRSTLVGIDLCESAFFLSTQAQVETRILGPLLVVWWIGLGSPQLNEG